MITKEKRFAAMQMGKPFVTAIHPPSGSSTPLSRFMSLALYFIPVPIFGDPFDGWTVGARTGIWSVAQNACAWATQVRAKVWTVER